MTPGVRGLGLWEADAGIGCSVRMDIEEAAERCRFPLDSHEDEPGCARRRRVGRYQGEQRYASYQALRQETKTCARAAKSLTHAAWRKPPTGENAQRAGRARSASEVSLFGSNLRSE